MPVWIKNSGNGDAHNVYAYISSPSDYITITDNYEEYPDISAGEIKGCYDDFGFFVNSNSLSPGDPEGTAIKVRIDLEIHCDEGTFNDLRNHRDACMDQKFRKWRCP
jgi:hypothetical protein